MKTIAGKYEVLKKLGEGGLGEVYLVKHRLLQAHYALKVLSAQVSKDEHVISKFKQEAEILFRFTHPGSVQLRDFGRTEDGHYYMTMDYCEGHLLTDELIEHKRFSIDFSLSVMAQVLAGLEAAHKLGIIHRDIKPDNLILIGDYSADPTVKILDFGISSLKERLGVDSPDAPGGTVGTPDYMAPEQASGDKDFDQRVDIYACGILLYEMLSGKVPFHGKDVVETLLMQLIQPLDPLPVELNVPIVVEEIIAKATRKDPDKRLQTASEFLQTVVEAQRLLAGDVPIAELPAINANIKASPSGSKPPPNEDKKNTKILCLDDDPLVLNIIQYLFAKEGFTVFTASSFSTIHGFLFDEQVDLMLCDVQLPGLSGARVCQMVKQNMPQVKILLFSNLTERELEKLAKESRADGIICKGWEPGRWVSEAKEMIKKA